jgi:hypothetical protein
MNPLEKVFTVTETSRELKVTIQHVRRLCRENRLVSRQSEDGTWLILKSSVEAYKKEGKEK